MATVLEKFVRNNVPHHVKARKAGKYDLYEAILPTEGGQTSFTYNMTIYDGLNAGRWVVNGESLDVSSLVLPWKYDYNSTLKHKELFLTNVFNSVNTTNESRIGCLYNISELSTSIEPINVYVLNKDETIILTHDETVTPENFENLMFQVNSVDYLGQVTYNGTDFKKDVTITLSVDNDDTTIYTEVE